MAKPETPETGPAPEAAKVDGNWKELMKEALQKKHPPSGFPKQRNPQQPKKK